ncbi:MAG: DUF4845 domain-containing protein [Steroidobacteraceae bacterium]|jgi:hypothetical protein
MRHRQQGMTFIGMLCIFALVGFFAYAGIRLVPVYLNYMKIVRSMEQVASEFKGENPDQARMRISLGKHWDIDDIGQVESKDVEIKKDEDGVTLHVAYDHSVPYLGNVSLVASFDKTVKVQ